MFFFFFSFLFHIFVEQIRKNKLKIVTKFCCLSHTHTHTHNKKNDILLSNKTKFAKKKNKLNL